MTERPDAEPRRQAPDAGPSPAHDLDPTGVRGILSSLADPGPMPHDLVRRISASLAEEQARRDQDRPLIDPHMGEVHSFDEALRRRHPLSRRLPSIAIAASIVVLAGAVVLGVLSAGGFRFGGAGDSGGSDAAAGSMMASAESMADGELDAADESGAARDTAGADGDDSPTEGVEGAAPLTSTDEVFFLATGRDLTDATFAEEAAPLATVTSSVWDQDAEARLADSTVGTVSGAADCLTPLLDVPHPQVEARIAVIDSVSYSGTPAALILLTDAPTEGPVVSGPMTAYLVPLDCRREMAVTLREPARVG